MRIADVAPRLPRSVPASSSIKVQATVVRFHTANFPRDQPHFVELRRRHARHVGSTDQGGDGGGLDKPRHPGSRLTLELQEGHLDPQPLCQHRHDNGARALPAASVVDLLLPQVPRARAESVRMHFVVSLVSANPLIVARDLLRMLREQVNGTLNLLRHLVALADRMELRVHHHCGGQFLEGVIDRINEVQLHERGRTCTSFHHSRASRAHHLRRHVLHQQRLGPAVHRSGTAVGVAENALHSHPPQVGKLDVLKRHGEVNERRGGRKDHRSGEIACHAEPPGRVLASVRCLPKPVGPDKAPAPNST